MGAIKQVSVDIGGKQYQIVSDDEYLEHIRGKFEPEMVSLFRALATGSRAILDIGANIGCTALLFGDLADHVYAFEPSLSTFEFLRQNTKDYPNIITHNIGLGAESGQSVLAFSPMNRSGGFVSSQIEPNTDLVTEKILIRRLDDVADDLGDGIDFIKIDVEGFEGHVLRGAGRTLTTYRPTVVLELNHWCLNAFQRTSIPDFFDFLRSVFPILLAVDGLNYLDLHDRNDAYTVMYYHILHMRFPNLVGAFDHVQLGKFREQYQHRFSP